MNTSRASLAALAVLGATIVACSDTPTSTSPSNAAIPSRSIVTHRRYGAHVLPTLGGIYTQALSINDLNVTVGYSSLPVAGSHAVLWSPQGVLRDLGTLGGDTSIAWFVNDLGEVVGNSQVNAHEIHAYRWTAARGMTDLGTLGGSFSTAISINDAGEIAGGATDIAENEHAVLWSADRKIHDLGSIPDGISGEARSINNRGDVAGYDGNTSGANAVLWPARRPPRLLGSLGLGSNGRAVNDLDQVVGIASLIDEREYRFVGPSQAACRISEASAALLGKQEGSTTRASSLVRV
jgi:probable HAF family extracellular repeat protein